MFDTFKTIFGAYAPIVTTLEDGTVITDIDFAYIGCVLFSLICLYCVLRIFGSVISGVTNSRR